VVKVFGPSEAEVNALLRGLEESGTARIAYCVNFPEIFVKIRVEGGTAAEVDRLLADSREEVRRRVGEYIYAEDDETIDGEVARLFREKGGTLFVAESCTGGLLAKRITDVPGSSGYFLGGVVSYADAAKSRLLGVSSRLLAEHGAVSAAAAEAMAQGARQSAGSDIALAITGIAGPAGGSPEKPVGTVFVGLAGRDGCRVERYQFHGNREEIRLVTSFTALNMLRKYLLDI
jgi:nicotinamide-nucleotide amidase